MRFEIFVINFLVCNSLFGFAREIEEFICQKIIYRVNDCNLCSCVQEDLPQLICTRMGCDYEETDVDCNVGTSWFADCNKCWCVKEIGKMCTAKKCNYY